MGWPCSNCERDVDPQEAKFFGSRAGGPTQGPAATIFVCKECFELAELFHQRGLAQARQLVTLLVESIQLAIVEKRLRLGPLPPQRDMTKREVFEEIQRLLQRQDEQRAARADGLDSERSDSREDVRGFEDRDP